MPSPEQIKAKANLRSNEAIHRHLQTQFFGVKTKLIQEIDALTGLKNELHKAVECLKKQLEQACKHYGDNIQTDLQYSINEFCNTCEKAIDEYQCAPSGYPALGRNGIDQETMDNLFKRFQQEIESAIKYTGEHAPKSNELSSSSFYSLWSLKARFITKEINTSTPIENSENKPS